MILSGCASQEKQPAIKPVETPKPVAVVIAPAEFDEAALGKIEEQLIQKKIDFDLVSIQAGKFVGRSGREVEIKKTSWEIKPEDYRAVVFVGGTGMAAIAKDETLVLLAQGFAKSGKKLAAFGEGNDVLRGAGILDGQGQTTASATEPSSDSASIEQVMGSINE